MLPHTAWDAVTRRVLPLDSNEEEGEDEEEEEFEIKNSNVDISRVARQESDAGRHKNNHGASQLSKLGMSARL